MRRRKKFSRTWPRFWDVKIISPMLEISTISEGGEVVGQTPGLETKDFDMQLPPLPALPALPAPAEWR